MLSWITVRHTVYRINSAAEQLSMDGLHLLDAYVDIQTKGGMTIGRESLKVTYK